VAEVPTAVENSPLAAALVPTAAEVAVEATAPSASPVTKFVPKNWPLAYPAGHNNQASKSAVNLSARRLARGQFRVCIIVSASTPRLLSHLTGEPCRIELDYR